MTDMHITEPVGAEVIDQSTTNEATEATEPTADAKKEVESIKFAKWEVKMIFNAALSSIKINNISKEDKINLIKLKIGLSKVQSELETYEKSVVESLKNDEYAEYEKAVQEVGATEEAKVKFKELQKELEKSANEICMEEYNKEVSIECAHLTDETFYMIADSFDMQMLGGYDYIYNKLVKQ